MNGKGDKPIQLSMEVEDSPKHKQLQIDFEQLQEKYEALKIENKKLSAKIDTCLLMNITNHTKINGSFFPLLESCHWKT